MSTTYTFIENITARVKDKKDFVYLDRTEQTNKIIEILGRSRARCPVIVGPIGSGRSTLLDQLAHRLLNYDSSDTMPEILRLDLDNFQIHSHSQFAKTLASILSKTSDLEQSVIIFLDELESLLLREPDSWPALLLTLVEALQNHSLHFGLVCTPDIYFEKLLCLPKIQSHIEPVFLPNYSESSLINLAEEILKSSPNSNFLQHDHDFLKQVIAVSRDYLQEESLPASMLGLLDKVIAKAKLNHASSQTASLSAQLNDVLINWYHITPSFLTSQNTPQKLRDLSDELNKVVFGQTLTLNQLQQTLLNHRLGLSNHPPCLSLLFHGEKSIGKRTTALALHDFIYTPRIPSLQIDLKTTKTSTLKKLLCHHLSIYPASSILFLQAERLETETASFLQQILRENRVTDAYRRTFTLNHCLFIFIHQASDHTPLAQFDEDLSIIEEQEELLQLVVTDLPHGHTHLLTHTAPTPIHEETSSTAINLPESFLRHVHIFSMQSLTFSSKERIVTHYLQTLSNKLSTKFSLSLIYNQPFSKNLLLRLNLVDAPASAIKNKLDETLLPLLTQNLLDIPHDARALRLEFAHEGHVQCQIE